MDPWSKNLKPTLQNALTSSSILLSQVYSKQLLFNQIWHPHCETHTSILQINHPIPVTPSSRNYPTTGNGWAQGYCKATCNHDTFIKHIIMALSELQPKDWNDTSLQQKNNSSCCQASESDSDDPNASQKKSFQECWQLPGQESPSCCEMTHQMTKTQGAFQWWCTSGWVWELIKILTTLIIHFYPLCVAEPILDSETQLRGSLRAGRGSSGSIQQLKYIENIQLARPS